MSRTAIFFATGYEEIEALTVVDILRRAGEEITMVSVTDERSVTSSHGVEVTMDKVLSEVNFDETDVIVLPGGMPGTKNLEACAALMEQVDAFVQAGKTVAAVCAAPSILGHRGHLNGKKACSFPDMESQLEGAEVLREPAVIDGNIITGRGMGAAIPFGLAILEKLQGKEAAEAMGRKIVYL
ncbi:MAG: DJ-1/PfpI family protein [Lachnospiraceae bacterium]|jgi:4-methyl-5(b-hydroxyethyl)-thiazole monophosphate biosynthesis|nr:DJ-1/PfpI family protein [Lachnospiraceae bacterium]MCI9397464.1 DJ-1/PfpI family protein [Lachnospiraceae bacterium]